MNLQQLHEDYDDENDPEFDQHVQSEIAANFTQVEALSEGGLVPLDPHAYDMAAASQESVGEWFDVLLVNDTEQEDYAQALNAAQTPMASYLHQHNDDFVTNDAVASLKQLSESLGDRFTISQLAQVNAKWVEIASGNTHTYGDIRNNPDLGSEYADKRDFERDPSGYQGVRNSDFI